MNLLKLSARQLKEIDKQTIHDGYKKIMAFMLREFYIDCSDMISEKFSDRDFHEEDLKEFIMKWLDEKITKEPVQDWKPGDCGK